jgi:hypothetical protein
MLLDNTMPLELVLSNLRTKFAMASCTVAKMWNKKASTTPGEFTVHRT